MGGSRRGCDWTICWRGFSVEWDEQRSLHAANAMPRPVETTRHSLC